jgi:hypothetical protein
LHQAGGSHVDAHSGYGSLPSSTPFRVPHEVEA